MSNTFLFPVTSRPTVDFLDALAAAGSSLTPPFAGGPINTLKGLPPINARRFLVRAIEYLAVENVGLEFDFFGSAAGLTDVIGTDTFISRFQFASVNGAQFNATGLYRYYVDGLAIPVLDLDSINTTTPPALHVAVQNVDTVAKTVDAAGAVKVTIWVEPMQGW